MNSLFKKLALISVFCFGFFFISGTSFAEACQVTSFNSRIPTGSTINNYSDETPAYYYLDIQTANCDTATGNVLRVLIQNLDVDVDIIPPISPPEFSIVPIQDIRIRVKQTGSTSQQGGSVNFETTSSNFTIPLIVGEEGNLGSCGPFPGYEDCNLSIKIFNTSVSGSPEVFNVPSTGLQYECDAVCNLNWGLGCPQGQGVTPNVLPYGSPNICSTDTGTVNVTTPGTSGGGSSVASGDYSTEPLAPLPGFTGNPNLGQWLESLFTILIVIAGLLALIMIIVGGITYMTSESFGGKGQAKEYIINAIVGLILALGAWVILNTINPDLAEDLNLNIPVVELGNYNVDSSGIVSETPAGTTGTSSICKDPNVNQVPNCPTCQTIPAPIQSQVANNGATPSTISKLVSFQSSISGIPWTVTEGFSPSRAHCARCHYIGTCIDADFTIAPTNINVKAFIDAAKSNGLKAQYETSSVAEFNSLVQFGLIPRQEVLLFPGTWISGSHFSVYNQ